MGGGVKGIVLDASALLAATVDGDGNGSSASLRPGAEYLLRKLRYSKIPTGISYAEGLSALEVNLLQDKAKLYSFDCFVLKSSTTDDLVQETSLVWGDNEGSFMYIISDYKKEPFLSLNNTNWVTVILRSPGQESDNDVKCATRSEIPSTVFINKLEEVPFTICLFNKKAIGKEVLVVGYLMKPSREEDFAKRGAFPLKPTQNGLIFVPLNYELPISSQIENIDGVLHKATDEIIAAEMSSSSDFANRVVFTKGMQELQRCTECHPNCSVIDPFNNIHSIMDRLKIQQLLLGLENLNSEGHPKIRGPHFLKLNSFGESQLEKRLADAKLCLPTIVKPQVACGVADAHSMAIVFKVDDFKDLNVPLPAVVQEYVDHSSTLYKFYVLGKKVFYAVKKSTPNADTLMKLCDRNGFKPLLFDSLKSLPIDKENAHSGDTSDKGIDLQLVTDAANWLKRTLDLTILGFDVVIQEGTGDHVVVDVNYLPSFKEVPDDIAIPAFWEAIRDKLDLNSTSAS
ncbi:inositol 1,3,4-trisphosphate 5/6-kinase 4 [Ipomoea triloba]|uniref:inositol 1,3,4-trisphosphate 5/6-kinase 4 n=1 Tax=Ipomoea triloba TaxID=35885 RepID=UPI00125D6571|nr:inositol 1,3,4-trisphosphate 5/6-kinase 4 [Ipomoea triloba]